MRKVFRITEVGRGGGVARYHQLKGLNAAIWSGAIKSRTQPPKQHSIARTTATGTSSHFMTVDRLSRGVSTSDILGDADPGQ
ncbi:hypothetical protein ACFO1B_43425 [Dactylosporangium siamense]|uniref:Uncharacterized protein n=1 Tax=Dactylosporangium siamense TaxID=685454 RepID=A0A919UD06_9ACTN|nr:hypothetical protein [Dactylosporangium siamense]GIG51009.1 hypothetical protein Dsi01nite_090500 [Dactylosporangium siamense]